MNRFLVSWLLNFLLVATILQDSSTRNTKKR